MVNSYTFQLDKICCFQTGDGSEEEDEEEEESDEESDDDAMKHTSDLESDAEEEEVTTTPAQTKPTQVKDIRTILKVC